MGKTATMKKRAVQARSLRLRGDSPGREEVRASTHHTGGKRRKSMRTGTGKDRVDGGLRDHRKSWV